MLAVEPLESRCLCDAGLPPIGTYLPAPPVGVTYILLQGPPVQLEPFGPIPLGSGYPVGVIVSLPPVTSPLRLTLPADGGFEVLPPPRVIGVDPLSPIGSSEAEQAAAAPGFWWRSWVRGLVEGQDSPNKILLLNLGGFPGEPLVP